MSFIARLRAFAARAEEHRASVVGINRRNVELVYPHNRRADFPIADDKLLAKTYFERASVPTAQTLMICEGLFAVRRTAERLSKQEQFVVKPANGSGGSGILVVGSRLGAGRWVKAGGEELSQAALEKHLADIIFGAYANALEDQAFIEERVRPHPFFHGLWPDGLCDIRVILLDARPLMAMIRVPTTESQGRANLHQGGLGIAVDLKTGSTFRALHHGRPVTRHPESGAQLLGLVLPRWEEALSVAVLAARSVPLRYLGVDVVVDEVRGSLVLEINVRPGLEIQNVNGRGLWPAASGAVP